MADLPQISFYDKKKIDPQILHEVQEIQREFLDDLHTIFQNVYLYFFILEL